MAFTSFEDRARINRAMKRIGLGGFEDSNLIPQMGFCIPVVEIPQFTKSVACGKCGREILVGKNTVLAYCRECSATLGVKK